MSEKVYKFLTTVGAVWGKRHESEEAQREWYKAWIFGFDKYEPWVLEAAARKIVDEGRYEFFPKPHQVHEICCKIIADERASKPEMAIRPEQQHPDPFALADALINCEMGRQAARAEPCWLLALHDFCRANRRLPANSEIPALKRTAEDFETHYRNCVTGQAGDFSKGLEALGATMMRRRENLRARLLGREAA